MDLQLVAKVRLDVQEFGMSMILKKTDDKEVFYCLHRLLTQPSKWSILCPVLSYSNPSLKISLKNLLKFLSDYFSVLLEIQNKLPNSFLPNSLT